MSNEYISFKYYSQLCNRVAGWLVQQDKTFNKRPVYGAIGRPETDLATIEKVALERYEQGIYADDTLINEYVECAFFDNNTDLSFMPNHVTGEDGVKWSISTLQDMCSRVSSYEVQQGKEPVIVYIKSPTPTPTPTPTPSTGVYEQILDMNNTPCDQGYSQCTNYYCACNSVQCMIKFHTGRYISEYKLASVGGTTTSGTSHNGINSMTEWFNRNYPEQLTIEWKSFSELGFEGVARLFTEESSSLFFHLLYRNKYGHYEVPRQINLNNKTIQVYNSLSGGYLENRSFSTQQSYINGISQKGVCIIRRVK